MSVWSYLEGLGIIWLAACVAAVAWFFVLDSREQRRLRGEWLIAEHDWPTPDLEEIH